MAEFTLGSTPNGQNAIVDDMLWVYVGPYAIVLDFSHGLEPEIRVWPRGERAFNHFPIAKLPLPKELEDEARREDPAGERGPREDVEDAAQQG